METRVFWYNLLFWVKNCDCCGISCFVSKLLAPESWWKCLYRRLMTTFYDVHLLEIFLVIGRGFDFRRFLPSTTQMKVCVSALQLIVGCIFRFFFCFVGEAIIYTDFNLFFLRAFLQVIFKPSWAKKCHNLKVFHWFYI